MALISPLSKWDLLMDEASVMEYAVEKSNLFPSSGEKCVRL